MKLKQTDQNNEELKSLAKRIFFIDKFTGQEVELPYTYNAESNAINIYVETKKRSPNMIEAGTVKDGKPYIGKHAIQFFVDSIPLPSDDPELIKLREQYFAELKALHARPQGCKSCEQGALMRKFIPLISKYYLSDEEYENPNRR